MFVVREVVHCKPGRAGSFIKTFKEVGAVMTEMGLAPYRIYSDFSGVEFWTVVLERDYETLDEFGEVESRVMTDERVKLIMAGYHDLIQGGHKEILKVQS